MAKLILLLTTVLLLSATRPEADVYICKSGSAYAYHKIEKCNWLQNCTHKIEKITLKEAIETYRRKPCKPCYK